ncbi:Acetophenone carboxylase gamma subunit [Maioricimonas rarisocia]|uniref:Acetophenone carboxylase gamma subunit n=2 Tax=Maioricimonas rarisocia TaxID=2528026 RepID=A0A517Z8C3_9PLAN|nr:Acetophenone carboxylase gamma subunit [Maioricimonas rarisocia]
MQWQFWIDVGGTFTDCVAVTPDGEMRTFKTLSSGVTKGDVGERGDDAIVDPRRAGDPPGFWSGYAIRFLDPTGSEISTGRVTQFDADSGALTIDGGIPSGVEAGCVYELTSGEEAPIVAIRYLLGLQLDEPIPAVTVRLGTTRGTNALLERKGARTALVTTRGFADVLLIGNQDRPRLFDLAIRKPEPLFTEVVEIDERLDAEGDVLTAVNAEQVRAQLADLHSRDIDSIAICLLNSYVNPDHERVVADVAREVGFEEISVSSRLSPLIKIVSRGDTTVMDAYLNPILREYVGSLRSALDEASSLRLMTSAGGLVDADSFVGKDSILSGPAGGVIGFSRVAEQAGFPRSIGFDMGGTSTDVSRYDGQYELEYETTKAGVRVVSPMLAIETVAAGGGSICDFDGVKLMVGPESAGADPGPACYGAGGPLTVTDVNLALGRLLPEQFPFSLDEQAVWQRLETLCNRIAESPLGKTYTPVELAQGFVDIANANMVRAIRRISVARGYDPGDYALVTFGGAGGQHACAIARSLGTHQILLHPYAGILSAYGMGLADVRRFGEQSVLKTCSADTLEEIEPAFQQLEERLRDDVIAEGVPADQVQPGRRSLDMRYVGVESTINVPLPEDGNYAARYEELHEQLYGYRHTGRGIEIVAQRMEVIGHLPHASVPPQPLKQRFPEPSRVTETWFAGEKRSTGVYLRSDLQPGDEFAGPAILCEPTSTIVVEPGFSASVRERGEIVLSDVRQPEDSSGSSDRETGVTTEADPVLLEIFNNLFASIAEQMGVTLRKTSISTNVKERLDFSCAIFDRQGELVVNAPHIPVHLGAMSETVKAIIADNRTIRPGDVFVTNDPYRGGSHLPDVTVITPVIDRETDEILFFTASRAHHAEIGGIVPGSMPPFSKNLAEEGVLIRNFRLVDGGESREKELEELFKSGRYPTRNVHDNLADISAQVAANQTGHRLLEDLIDRYSLAVVQSYMGHIQQAASLKMRMALARLEDREYERTDHLDDGSPIAVTITISGETATVDFTGTGPVLATNLNANRAIVTAAVLYVFRCLIDEDIPLNGGVLEPVEIVLPECLLNPPAYDDPAKCAAMVGGNVETSQRVVDVLLGALGVAAASQGTMNNLTFGDERFGYYETICGGSGATANSDGADAVHTHMTNTRLTDAEVMERRYPVRVQEFSIRRGSGGNGTHRGGDGIIRRLEFLRPLSVAMLSQRRAEFRPFGLNGGRDGAAGRNLLQRAGLKVADDMGGCFQTEAAAGDVLTIETPGGGGHGG